VVPLNERCPLNRRIECKLVWDLAKHEVRRTQKDDIYGESEKCMAVCGSIVIYRYLVAYLARTIRTHIISCVHYCFDNDNCVVVSPSSVLTHTSAVTFLPSPPTSFFLFQKSIKKKMPSHIMRGLHRMLRAEVLEKRQNPSSTCTFSFFTVKNKLNLAKLQLAPTSTSLRLWVKSSIHRIL
jgi:hypothetical protein